MLVKSFRIFLIFLSAFSGLTMACAAQKDARVDSMLTLLKSQPDDTNKVNTLNALSRRCLFRLGDYDLARKYAEQSVDLSKKLNFKVGTIYAYTNLGFTYNYQGDYESAISTFRKVLQLAEEMNSKAWLGSAYNNIGLVLADQGNPAEAINNYRQSARIFEESGNKRSAANSYYNIGNTYYSPLSNFTEAIKAHFVSLNLSKEVGDKDLVASRYIDIGNNYESLGDYPAAIKNYLAALKISEETGNRGNVAAAYNNIGEIYNNQNKWDDALKYYEAGLKVYREIDDKEGIGTSLDNIGEIYQKQGKFAEAIQNHRAALKILEAARYNYGMAYSYRNLGNAHYAQGKYGEALDYYLSSLKLFKQMEENEGLAKINNNIGETYFKLKDYGQASKYLNESLGAASEFHGKKILAETYGNLAALDSATGNWEQAFIHQRLFALYRDSLVNQENSDKIMKNMMQFQFDKKEDSLRYQQALIDEKLKRQTLLAAQQRQSLQLKEQEVDLLNNERKLQNLQLQKNEADYAVQKAETDKKQTALVLLGKEKDIQSLQLKKQRLLKNYLLAGLGVLVVLAIFLYSNYRTRQELKLQTLRNKIASDLHDDVGSTLSSISIFSQIAQQQSREVIPMLETIGESSRKMLDAMADIVWTINPENDQFERIIARMKNFAYELLGAKNIDFEFVAEDEVSKLKLPMEVRKNLYLIFKEATNNMVKYAHADKAMFAIKGEKNGLTMMIKDNGKGFDPGRVSEGNGLKNMKRRAQEIGASLVIDSNPGNGTLIQLNMAI